MPKSSSEASDNALQQRQQLIAAARGGDADAQCRMGDICRTGDEFTVQDYPEALRWYRLAAEQGDPNAQNNIGAMYQNGLGVPEDMTEAAKWYRRSADRGLATAQYNLGECCLYGTGVNVDEVEAAAWLHKAAEQGHIEALSELGTMYLFGRGVERRIGIAAEMLTVAALDGDMNALGTLADYHGQIEAEALGGNLLASLSLAKVFDRGLGVEPDKAKMFAWLLWADRCPTRDSEIDVRQEQDDMRGFYGLTLPDDIKDQAWAIFNEMRAAKPSVGGTKTRRQRKAASEPDAGGH